jgi:hypothetical protein
MSDSRQAGQGSRGKPRAPRRRSVRGKLVLLVVSSVGMAVALVAAASAWREGSRAAALETARLSSTATVIASVAAEATASGDRGRAFRALRSIGSLPGVV